MIFLEKIIKSSYCSLKLMGTSYQTDTGFAFWYPGSNLIMVFITLSASASRSGLMLWITW
jgi:hypothetical protein